MKGIFNSPNFFIGLALANNFEQAEKLRVALAVGDSKSLMGPVLMKPLIDKRLELEVQKTAAENKLKEAETKIIDLENNITKLENDITNLQNELASANEKITILNRVIAVKVPTTTRAIEASLTINEGHASGWSLDDEAPDTVELSPDGELNIPDGVVARMTISVEDDGVTRKMELTVGDPII